jgi:hypothetical protein
MRNRAMPRNIGIAHIGVHTTMNTDTTLHTQWARRPDDERYTSLTALAAHARYRRDHSRQLTLPNRKLTVVPSTSDRFAIAVTGPNGHPATPTHWSFGQLASLAGAPAGYLRSGLPGALVADNLNWGLHYQRSIEDLGVLLRKDDNTVTLAAATGPNYGRVWDCEILEPMVDLYGDGFSGDWRVPGTFGTALSAVTKENTPLYGSDRDMWAFLANETDRVSLPNRRNGEPGTFARGFYISNSEVGAATITLGMFLFDYACCNRILWGVSERSEIRIRHTAGAPFRWQEEVLPVLQQFARTDTPATTIEATLRAAKAAKIDRDIDDFITKRFGSRNYANAFQAVHMIEEERPIETIFDLVTAATAHARTIKWQDDRVAVERNAGALLATLATH